MKIVLKFISAIWAICFLSFIFLLLYSGTGGKIPDIAKNYVSSFNDFLEFIFASHSIFIFFIVGWFVFSYTLGKESGWKMLADKFGDNNNEKLGEKSQSGNGYIGKTRYNGILKIAANKNGIYLSVFYPFQFGHKKLYIPWEEVSVITLENVLFSDKKPSFFESIGKSFSKTKYLNIVLHQLPEQRITIQCFDGMLSLIPKKIMK